MSPESVMERDAAVKLHRNTTGTDSRNERRSLAFVLWYLQESQVHVLSFS